MSTHFRNFILVLLVAISLTVIFWQPLWTGGGLIGGDTYAYFFPQKAFYADSLQSGEFPLWNNRVGHGYPLVGESQTGPFYPFNLLAYSTLSVNTAYNAIHLLHYVLCFVFTWLYARRLGVTAWPALLAATIFTYGWFPERSCWEWAIVTGAWLPVVLWCLESFLQSARWRYLIAFSGALGMQLLAGHYNLAFVTHVVIVAYLPLRLWYCPDRIAADLSRRRIPCLAFVATCLFCAYTLTAVQFLPSWELKQNSQRAVAGGATERRTGTGYDPGYGHLPPMYLMQIVMPWDWYPLAATGELDGVLSRLNAGAIDSATNMIEAHLYFGMIPIVLIAFGMVWRLTSRPRSDPRFLEESGGLSPRMIAMWMLLGLAAVIYATGWLLPLTRQLPGFSFFTGPGRFGIVATLAAALIAASVLDRLLARIKQPVVAALVATTLIGGTIYDFHWVSRLVTNAFLVQNPPITMRTESKIAELLHLADQSPRLFAPGANLATLTGAAATPVYLGIGPAPYFDKNLKMPSMPQEQMDGPVVPAAPGQVEWLQRAGVTHILSLKPLILDQWPAELVYSGPDRMLNRAWARRSNAPLFLYQLKQTRGRASLNGTADISNYSANQVVIETNSDKAGQLILTDLMYPGWNVTIDGQPAEPRTIEGMYRAVDLPAGKHQVVWTYQPASLYWGAVVSLATLFLLAAVAHIRYWHPRLLSLFDQEPTT